MVKDEKTGQEVPLVSPTLPPAIFDTTGTILEIKSDRIIVQGKGTNFADGVSRTLTVIFTDTTLTFSKDKTFRWKDEAGLKQLQPGMQILIGGAENIRGKIEFKAKTISML